MASSATLSPARATLLVLLAACCFGSVAVLTVLATRAGASLASVLVWRYLLGALGLALVAGGVRALRLPPAHALRILVLGGAGQAAVAGLSLYALKYLAAGVLSFLFYTYPAWVAAIAAMRGTDRLTAPRVGALVLSLIGIGVMVGTPSSGAMHPVGVALALGSALVYALYIPFVDRLQTGTTAVVTSAYITAGAALWLAVLAPAGSALLLATGAAPDPWLALSARLTTTAWIAVACLAIFSTTLAFAVFLRGLGVLGSVRTSIISTVEPFWTTIAGALLLGQPLTRPALAGGALIAAAVILLQRRD